jgi:phosphoglycerate dehydrogenase-like enzyme
VTNVVVTFGLGAVEREALTRLLAADAHIEFIKYISREERARALTQAHVMIAWSPEQELSPDEFELIRHVRLVQLLSAGADHVPFSRFSEGVVIASNVGAWADPMAEHVLGMILAVYKNLLDRHNKLKKGDFDQAHPNRMLRGSSCAFLGFGGIGKTTAKLLRCFGVKILALNTTGKTSEQVEFIGSMKDLEYVLRLADIVVVALPLTASTRGLIGERELGWMKPDAILVNVARGEIVDEGALFRRLKANTNFTAAIDAWWIEPLRHGEFRTNYPFLELSNVLGSPHNSAIAIGSLLRATQRAALNVKRFLSNEPIIGVAKAEDYTPERK